jgi:hypothetical protein
MSTIWLSLSPTAREVWIAGGGMIATDGRLHVVAAPAARRLAGINAAPFWAAAPAAHL